MLKIAKFVVGRPVSLCPPLFATRRLFSDSTLPKPDVPIEPHEASDSISTSTSTPTPTTPQRITTSISSPSTSKATPVHLLQRKRMPVTLDEHQLVESFIKGGGKGGQCVNKNASCVQLTHAPSGISVRTQRFRDLAQNRKEARKLLSIELDAFLNGDLSKRSLENKKEADRKKKSAQKAKKRLKEKWDAKKEVHGEKDETKKDKDE
ncbi:UNVERIFIED_CONTAM: hypothetical protein HDU68_003940 [Siphonaria sp. JEL0065]|nr:hypothetical protein HDU68_003940 [Siphonaria sp. JEL0065]